MNLGNAGFELVDKEVLVVDLMLDDDPEVQLGANAVVVLEADGDELGLLPLAKIVVEVFGTMKPCIYGGPLKARLTNQHSLVSNCANSPQFLLDLANLRHKSIETVELSLEQQL